MKDLGTLGGDFSQSFSINAAGWVTGFASDPANNSHAFVHDGTRMRDQGTLGGPASEGNAINASNQVAGWQLPQVTSSTR
jgi:probable HAF family extracellular repeat protein